MAEHESSKTQEKSSATSLPAADQVILKKLHDEMRKLTKASSEVYIAVNYLLIALLICNYYNVAIVTYE